MKPTPKPIPSSTPKRKPMRIKKPTSPPPPPPPPPPPGPPKPHFDCNIYAGAGQNISEDPRAGASVNEGLANGVTFRVSWTVGGSELCEKLGKAITEASEGQAILDGMQCFAGVLIAELWSTYPILLADIVPRGIKKAYPESDKPRCTRRDKNMVFSDRDPTDSTPGQTEQGEKWKKKCKKYNVMIWWMALFKPKCKYVPPNGKKPTG